MDRSRRFILFLAATAFAAPLLIKGHAPSHQDGNVAFVPSTSAGVAVRVTGVVSAPGVYHLPAGATVRDVTKLTAPGAVVGRVGTTLLDRRLENGDVVEVTGENPQRLVISLLSMKAGERMLLGIPLDPDRMDVEDWDALPGIGPHMARAIVEDRQKNGYFRSVEALRRVPGIGEKKLAMIRSYF